MGMAGIGAFAAGPGALLAMFMLVHATFFGTHTAYFFAKYQVLVRDL